MPATRPFVSSVWFRARAVRVLVASACGSVVAAAEVSTTKPDAAAAAVTPSAPVVSTVAPAVENAVVKVFTTVRYPDPFRPWTKQPPQEVTGSGVVIDGKRILTNAHVVLYASDVQIQPNQSGDKISASVEAIAPGIDLAVLKLDEESFFDTHPPLTRASVLPEIKDTVMAFGFPTGGTSLSITKGIVSRIEFTPYNFPVAGLRIQVDAPINPGNSGGPAIAGDKMIGVVFSMLGGAQNIGYIIPNEEIELFLADIGNGKYDGKPGFFEETQRLQNPALQAFVGHGRKVEGVMVHVPFEGTPANPLKKWDVITKIGTDPIDDEGMIKVGPHLRVRFDYRVQQVVKDGRVPLTIVREGKEMNVDLPVSPDRPMLVPDLQGTYPSYFVYGPLVFSTASTQLLGGVNRESLDPIAFAGSPLMTRRGDSPTPETQQLVIVSSPFFPHKLAKGYWPPTGWVVKAVDGTKIKSLQHLVEVLRDGRGDHVIIDFEGRGTESFVFVRKDVLAATDDILSDNGVRAQGSADMLAVWTAKPKS